MGRRTIGIAATIVIVILGTVSVMRRDRGGVTVDTQPAIRKATFRSFVTASGQVVAQRHADVDDAKGRVMEIGASVLPAVGTGAAAREFKVKVQLDIEVTGLNDGTPVATGPFQALRELKDGQAVRIQAPR
jgi:hypothetical protein